MLPEDFEKQAIERVKKHEGYRETLYHDPINPNIITGGYGHNFSEPISPSLAEKILLHDWEVAKVELSKAIDTAALNRLPYHRQYVLVELMFQVGLIEFKGFKCMIAAVNKGNVRDAAKELRDSLYYRQVTARAEELAKIFEV